MLSKLQVEILIRFLDNHLKARLHAMVDQASIDFQLMAKNYMIKREMGEAKIKEKFDDFKSSFAKSYDTYTDIEIR